MEQVLELVHTNVKNMERVKEKELDKNVQRGDIVPLKKGRSQAIISSNIRECVLSYKDKGTIGDITPKNLKHAMSICSGIAYKSAHRSKGKSVVSEALHK